MQSARSINNTQADVALIERVTQGDPTARAQLIDRLAPVIHLRVARVLRVHARERRSSRQEVEDFVQDIFTWMLASDWRAIRVWDPQRHASLDTFVGLLATHRVCSILRSKRRSPWTERPIADDSLRARANEDKDDLERRIAESELLDLILDRLTAEFDEREMKLFTTVILYERPIDEISATTGMSKGAIYTWKSRVAKRAREIKQSLLADRQPSRRD
jgi:RNA polymerase sigma factor (sigma-70 family)